MESENSSQEKSEANCGDRPTDQDRSEPQPQVSPAPSPAESHSPPTPASDKTPYEKKRDWLDYVKFGAEIVGLIVLIFYTTFAALQWYEMKKAAEAAKGANVIAHDALVKSNRPWLAVHGYMVTLDPVRIEHTKIPRAQTKITTKVGFVVKNFGTAPAFYTAVNTVIAATESGENVLEDWGKIRNETCIIADTRSSPIVPGQEGSGWYIFPDNRISTQWPMQASAINPGLDSALIVIGCISYRDQFKKPIHHTHFCFISNGPLSKVKANEVLTPCVMNQGAD